MSEAIPELRKRALETGRARIINTASVMAFDTDWDSRPMRLQGRRRRPHPHAGAGTRQVQHHRQLHLPGAIYSGMTQTNFDKPEIRAVWEKKAALRRLGQPLDIARGALMLASEDADFITGHGLVVDGGLTLRT